MALHKNFKRNVSLLSIGLFFVSLWLPCYHTPDDDYYGISALCLGWLLCTGALGTGWFANPLIAIAWITNKSSPLLPLVFSFIAFIAALIVPFQVAATKTIIYETRDFRAGYWLWVTSCLVTVIGNTIELITKYLTENDA